VQPYDGLGKIKSVGVSRPNTIETQIAFAKSATKHQPKLD
jgi:hypothetical protein